jgi:uncharacterized NAD-dependent epimerase/dehydratase family protein
LRYSQAEIVVVIDNQSAGKSLRELTKISRDIPIVASVAEAITFAPEILVIGIATSGGALPEEWFEKIKSAVASGLEKLNKFSMIFLTKGNQNKGRLNSFKVKNLCICCPLLSNFIGRGK